MEGVIQDLDELVQFRGGGEVGGEVVDKEEGWSDLGQLYHQEPLQLLPVMDSDD